MRKFLTSVMSTDVVFGSWKKRPACSLPGCHGSLSLWNRALRRSSGLHLQGAYYCRPQCAAGALTLQLAQLCAIKPVALPPHRIPLGLLMVARGRLTYTEVAAALEAQRRARYGSIGDWFEKLGFATEREVTSALGLQWGCPIASSLDSGVLPPFCQIPLPILNAFQMLPLQYAATTQTLYLAFGRRVDHAALYSIEKIIGCRTQACVGGSKSVACHLERMRQRPRPGEVQFGPMRDASEIQRVGLSYITKLGAQEARLGRVGQFIWLRLKLRTALMDMTFEIRAETEGSQLPQTLLIPPLPARAATTSA